MGWRHKFILRILTCPVLHPNGGVAQFGTAKPFTTHIEESLRPSADGNPNAPEDAPRNRTLEAAVYHPPTLIPQK